MQIILNGINGRYPLEILENATRHTELVEAAVAYASKEQLLFEWCWERKIPLRFWGRFDESVPVPVRILKTFLDRRSPNYTCKLLRHFHSKVIWWHGVGAYVGSANLSDAAWHNNVEAGFFFDEAEMSEQGIDIELQNFFRRIDQKASLLNDELFKLIESRAADLQRIADGDRDAQRKFLATTTVHDWSGLIHESPKTAEGRKRSAFLDEWYSTLQILRDIGTTISMDQHRPRWLPANVPSGAQADQFLHAHYYTHVIDEARRSTYEEEFEKNKNNPSRALDRVIEWWGDLPAPPTGEEKMLLEWAPFLRDILSPDRLLGLSQIEFSEICQRVWSIQDHARRVANRVLALPDGHYDMPTKTNALAKFLFERRAQNGSNILQVIYHVLYGDSENDLPNRLWDAIADSSWRIEHFGISALGELVGWALPDKFPPRNNRTSKSLRSLGYNVETHG